MQIIKNKNISTESKLIILKIDSYDNREPCGRIYNDSFKNEIEFTGLVQLILIVESLVDEIGFAKAAEQLRTFEYKGRDISGYKEEAADIGRIVLKSGSGKVADFALAILFRQHADWQGRLRRLGSGDEMPFRSVLELVRLLDSALYTPVRATESGETTV
jgi:hypothetical protein